MVFKVNKTYQTITPDSSIVGEYEDNCNCLCICAYK